VTESYLTDDDVSALEVLEAGGDLTDDQVGRLQALENTPFFAETIQQSEANSRRFAGAGFGPDGFVMSDASSPMVQAQPDPVPPTSGPVREDKPAQQAQAAQPDDGMRFDLVTPPPIDAVEMETNIRGPRLGAMGPVNESGDFFRDDEELLEALEAAPAKGIMLTREDFQTREELREKNNDTIGSLTTGAGNILSGLWQMAKGAAVEQGASPAAAIGQALSDAVFDPASAGKILVDGVKEASNRVVQAEVTKAEGARKAYIGVRQLWSWMDGTIENIEIDDERRQAVRNDLINTGAFGQDNVANAQLLEAEVAKRREQGLAPFAPTDKTAEYDTKYRRYWENEKLNRAYTGQNQYILDGRVVDEKPDIALSQPVTGFNPATGEQIQPLPYTSMLYGMAMQPDTYVGFGAGYFSKLRVMSRAAAASRPLFGGIELTAAKAAEAAKMGRDAQKFLRNSTIASGGLAATGLGMSFNDTTGTIGKGLLFFGGILPAMRATGYVLKRVPVANRFLEAGGILRPQALRIIAEESKAGPLGAGAAANTPATQAAAIRAARPESAARLAASGEVPQRYARFMGTKRTRQGDLNIQAAGQRGFDSTLKRVAQNPENPANVRRAARTADELGLTQVFRATDDALGGAIAGVVGSAPFAAIAPDDQTAGGILGAGVALGAAGSMVSGFTSFRGDAVDADIARFMADTDALGGDTKALFQMPHKQLAAMSSLQGTASNKGVDVVALRTEDYNRMVPEAIGSQGYFSAPTAKDGSKAGRQRIFVDLGHSSLEEGTARITQAPDGMYELTVTRKDGSVAYPLPAADGSQPVIRRKSANDFTVKDGDPVSPYFPLNRQPPRIVTASHEFMHALMKSDMFGGDHQPALRGLIYEQYKPDTIQSMAREYAQRLVDAQINNGRVPKPANDEAKAKMIDDMVTELDDASVASTGDRRAWIADEIVAETWQDIAQGIDVNRIRQGKSADGRVVDAARSAMIATTRALETFGMKFDWATGKPLTNPSTVFRDNPLATTPLLRKRILESVRNYDRYLTLLEDAGAVESKGAPLPRSGRAEDWLAEGTMRAHRKADGTMENDVMTVDPDGQVRWKMQDQIDNEYKGRATAVSDLLKRLGTKLVDDNDPTFGLRRAGVGRTIYSGAELPMSDSPLGYPPVLAAFPEYYRTMYKDAVDSGRAGELVRFSNNTVGTRSDSGGPYRLSQLISGGYAKQSEGLFYGMQITKSGGHMNMQFVDMNAFKASALRAINDGKIPFFNNDYKEVVRNLKQLMDNYRNQRDGSYMIGEEGKDILNGLLYGKSGANKGWGAKLNARGSIRTYRMDRMNWIERTGDDGYFFDNDRAKNNRMPETEPVDAPAMRGQAQPETLLPTQQLPKPPSYAKNAPIKVSGDTFVNQQIVKSSASAPKNVLETNPQLFFERINQAAQKIADDPARLANPNGYLEYMRDAGVWGNVLYAPPTLRTILENPQSYVDNLLGGYHGDKTKAGTMEAADAGLDATVRMRQAIGDRPPKLVTAMHHLWGILSRMLPPVEQESAWLRLVSRPRILEQMQASIDGQYRLQSNDWKALVQGELRETNVFARGRGNQGTANANAFHGMLSKWNGQWDRVSDVYSAENSIESGRKFWALGLGSVGIRNKVQRFIGLTYGIPALIMDRWKFVEFYYPQFNKGPQEYFKYSATGTPEDPMGIYGQYGTVEGGNPNFSLAFYEGMELALQRAIENSPQLQKVLGRHANVGGMHWKGWNAIKNEAVGHSSLDLTYDLVTANPNPTPETVLQALRNKEYYTEGLVGNRIERFALPTSK
jgi:hypothetical protein